MYSPIRIGIVGGSGSGKSYLTDLICRHFSDTPPSVLYQDNYYRDLSHLDSERAAATDFDDPAALELELLAQHLAQLGDGFPVESPQYDFATFSRLPDTVTVTPAALILVDGLFLLHHPAIAAQLDISIYVDVDDALRLARRLKRDTAERGYTRERILDFWHNDQAPSFRKYVQPQRLKATHIWDSERDKAFVPAFLADLRDRTTSNAIPRNHRKQ